MSPGQRVQGRSGVVAKSPAQCVDRCVSDGGRGAQTQTLQNLLRAVADTPQCTDRQLVQKADHLGLWHDEQPVGFGQTRRELRDELGLSLIHISEPTRLGMISY